MRGSDRRVWQSTESHRLRQRGRRGAASATHQHILYCPYLLQVGMDVRDERVALLVCGPSAGGSIAIVWLDAAAVVARSQPRRDSYQIRTTRPMHSKAGQRLKPLTCEFMVGVRRFELLTSSVSGKRSPPELNARMWSALRLLVGKEYTLGTQSMQRKILLYSLFAKMSIAFLSA
jgi:hypothetical protein